MMITKLALSLMLTAAPYWFTSASYSEGPPEFNAGTNARHVRLCCAQATGRDQTATVGRNTDRRVTIDPAGHAAVGAGKAVFVGSSGAGAGVIRLRGGPHAVHNTLVWSSDDQNGREHEVQLKVVTREQEDDTDAPKQGWLGVSIKSVSDETAEQLDIVGRGVIVLNVLNDSPAANGGIEANDIIMAINGDPVTGEAGSVVELVSGHAPGETVDVTVLRGGKERTLKVTLGSRSDIKTRSWKFDVAPFAEIEENVTAHGKMLRRNEDGEWVFEDLGDLTNIKELRDHLRLPIPGGTSQTTQVFVDGNSKSVKLEIRTDKGELSIEQEDGGEITVTRTDEAGTETTTVYEDEDALAEGDPDAFEYYQSSGKPIIFNLSVDGIEGLRDFDFDLDLDDLKDGLFDWRKDLHDQLSEAHTAYLEAMEQARKAYEEAITAWKSDGEDEDGDAAFSMPFFPFRGGHALFMGQGRHDRARPKHTFSVDADGVIEVRIRRGDAELVRHFESEADLATRNPELYAKFQELTEADSE
ncbi:MAG: S1C family serine protease [Phycisphaerae bacterium]